jgi:hypothetical protein
VTSAFTEHELSYLLGERRLAGVVTVGADGAPHVVPVGWSFNAELDAIEISGHDFAQTKKFVSWGVDARGRYSRAVQRRVPAQPQSDGG